MVRVWTLNEKSGRFEPSTPPPTACRSVPASTAPLTPSPSRRMAPTSPSPAAGWSATRPASPSRAMILPKIGGLSAEMRRDQGTIYLFDLQHRNGSPAARPHRAGAVAGLRPRAEGQAAAAGLGGARRAKSRDGRRRADCGTRPTASKWNDSAACPIPATSASGVDRLARRRPAATGAHRPRLARREHQQARYAPPLGRGAEGRHRRRPPTAASTTRRPLTDRGGRKRRAAHRQLPLAERARAGAGTCRAAGGRRRTRSGSRWPLHGQGVSPAASTGRCSPAKAGGAADRAAVVLRGADRPAGTITSCGSSTSTRPASRTNARPCRSGGGGSYQPTVAVAPATRFLAVAGNPNHEILSIRARQAARQGAGKPQVLPRRPAAPCATSPSWPRAPAAVSC